MVKRASWGPWGGFSDGTSQRKVPAASLSLPAGAGGVFFPFPDRAAGLAGHVGALAHRVLSLHAPLHLQNLLSVPFKSSLSLSWFLSLPPPANAEEG